MKENWKDIPGYAGRYQASDRGRVRSIDHYVRVVPHGKETVRLVRGRVLRAGTCDQFGHTSVALGKGNSKMVHEIIALTFIGRRPKKHDVAHKDGNGSNNRLKNLTYKTRGKNNEDIVYHGRRLLSVSQVRKIKRASSYKETCVLADRFGVSRGHAYNIMRGRGYAHIVA